MKNELNLAPEIENSPIGQLFNMGLTTQQISEITGVGNTGVSKWKNGRNLATMYAQNRAKGYLDGLNKNIEKAKPETLPSNHMFLVTVPPSQINRFMQIMKMLNLDAVDMDQP